MQHAPASPDEMLAVAIAAAQKPQASGLHILDALPAPIYTTDAEGQITYYNQACIDFAGRVPVVGEDSWCVTWKIYTEDGAFLPHDQCPMAVAIRQQRPIRGVEAVAERPDGTRVNFRPYPTPLLDEEGNLTGAVNMLIDVTGHKQAGQLRAQAARCRRLADGINDSRMLDTLKLMAADYEQKATSLERPN